MLKISDFYLDKQKSFIPKKNITLDSIFSAKRWCLDVLTFLIKGFDESNNDLKLILTQSSNPIVYQTSFQFNAKITQRYF